MERFAYVFFSLLLFLFALSLFPITAYLKTVAPAWMLADDGVYISAPTLILGTVSGVLSFVMFIRGLAGPYNNA